MTVKQLEFFKRTAELEHMTKAADELLVSQPYLSLVISDLENELGVALFDHVGRRIELNECGRAFYKRITALFVAAEDAKKEVRSISEARENRLTVVTNVSPYMPKLLQIIMESDPDVRIRQMSAPRDDIINLLKNGTTDFAICSPPIEDDKEFVTEHLRFELGVFIFPDEHPLKNRKVIDLREVKDETFITAAPGYGARIAFEKGFSILDELPPVVIETGDTSSVFQYVESGLGIAAMALSAVLQNPKYKTSYTNMNIRAGGDVALTYRKNLYISSAGELFINKVHEHFQSLNAWSESKNSQTI